MALALITEIQLVPSSDIQQIWFTISHYFLPPPFHPLLLITISPLFKLWRIEINLVKQILHMERNAGSKIYIEVWKINSFHFIFVKIFFCWLIKAEHLLWTFRSSAPALSSEVYPLELKKKSKKIHQQWIKIENFKSSKSKHLFFLDITTN